MPRRGQEKKRRDKTFRAPPNGLLVVREDQVLEFLHPLPVRVLWGVGPVTAKALETLGVHTIGQLAALEQDVVVGRLGSHGTHLYNRACGIDPRPVQPFRVYSNRQADQSRHLD